VAKAFAPRTLDADWEPRMREIMGGLLDRIEAKPLFDVIEDLAELPARITAEIVGVESARFEDFRRWSDEIVSATGPPQEDADGVHDAAGDSPGGLFAYLANTVADRRRRPQDDLVTRLVESEIDGVRLTDIEIVSFLVLLIVSGNDAVTDLIATCAEVFVSNPGLLEELHLHPGRIVHVVEEALRWDSPTQSFFRRACADAELAGKAIKAGDALLVLYAAANRDPNAFECPADFDAGRGRRDHLAFGKGVHYCLGANLTRLQARVAVEAIVNRFESLREVPDFTEQWRDAPFFRGRVSYPLEFTLRHGRTE
jgi:cytochrome P450